jgi:aspartate/methionine/tyrosine aminotransferase
VEQLAVNPLFEIPLRYAELDVRMHAPGAKVFISDWNGSHPFVKEYVGDLCEKSFLDGDVTAYALPEDDKALLDKIGAVHEIFDEGPFDQKVLVGNGATPLLSAFCLWLSAEGVRDIYYFPPLYYGIAKMLKMLNLNPRPVSRKHAFEPDFLMRLPDRKAVLFLTDPVWYAGRRVTEEQVRLLREWQDATGSLILVDGTFQYMQWDGRRKERTADLRPDQTFRLICPTKSLSLNGFRFAYLLQPDAHHEEMSLTYDCAHGATSLGNLMFAHRAINVMLSGENNSRMVDYGKANYERLIETGSVGEHLAPECGYFVFGRVGVPDGEYLAMDQSHFELDGFPGYVRVNLLNPAAMSLLTGQGHA